MPAVIDHAEGKPPGYEGTARNGSMIPQDRIVNGQILSAVVRPRPMFAPEPKPAYVFKGLNQFFVDAAKRAGFGETNDEASLLARAHSDWFLKQAAQAITNASVQTDPAVIRPSIERARKLAAVLRFMAQGIEDAIADREPEPSPIVTPEDLTVEPESIEPIETSERQPEITEHEPSTRHVRPGKSGKLGRNVH